MIDPVQLRGRGAQFDRSQIVLEILSPVRSGGHARTQLAALAAAPGRSVIVTIASPIPPAQGGGYLVAFRGRLFALPLRGEYEAGQQVRLAPGDTEAHSPRTMPFTDMPVQAESKSSLGDFARNIGALLARAEKLPPGAPLSVAAPGSNQALPPSAEALGQAIAESGVFYESHLLEWAQGLRTAEAIRREPQGRIVPPATTDFEASLPDSLLPVVNEQLRALDLGRLGWNGQIWSRQQAEIAISEDQSQQRDCASHASWTATISLTLAALGSIRAVLTLEGAAMNIELTANVDAEPLLRKALPRLAELFADAGVEPVAVHLVTRYASRV